MGNGHDWMHILPEHKARLPDLASGHGRGDELKNLAFVFFDMSACNRTCRSDSESLAVASNPACILHVK